MQHRVRLIEKKVIANGVSLFVFEKPKGFRYKAGQCADFTILQSKFSDAQGLTRTLTLSSSPHEKTIYIATKNTKSAFKRSLFGLAIGEKVKLEGPFGTFFLGDRLLQPLVFIAGGIGITPFFSILKDVIFKNEKRKVFLHYIFNNELSAAFLNELRLAVENSPNFFLKEVVTKNVSDKQTNSSKTPISKVLLRNCVNKYPKGIFYISGPIPFTLKVREMLLELGISDNSIKTDEFSGYDAVL